MIVLAMDLDRMIVSAELGDAFVGTFDQAETIHVFLIKVFFVVVFFICNYE